MKSFACWSVLCLLAVLPVNSLAGPQLEWRGSAVALPDCDSSRKLVAASESPSIRCRSLDGVWRIAAENRFEARRAGVVHPWCDVRDHGAVGDGKTDDTAAINVCINLLHRSGGGTIYFPQSHAAYCTFAGIVTIETDSIAIVGADRGSVTISQCNHNVTPVTLQGSYSRLENITILGRGAQPTDEFNISTPAFMLKCNVGCNVMRANFSGGSSPIEIIGGGDMVFFDTNSNYPYGRANIYVRASAGREIVSGWFIRVKADDVFPTGSAPNGTPGGATADAWRPNARFEKNAVITLGGYYLQCVEAGLTGTSAPALTVYNVDIPDGTAKWQLVSSIGSSGVQFDSGAYQWTILETDITGPRTSGMSITDTFTYPNKPGIFQIIGSTIGGAFSQNVNATIGDGLIITGSTIDACILSGCAGINMSGNWGHALTLSSNLIFGGGNGIVLGSGIGRDTNALISGNQIYGFKVAGFAVTAGISNFIFTGNQCGLSAIYYGANSMCYDVAEGSSDYYVINNNIVTGSVTPSRDGGTGEHKNVGNNF